MAIEIKNTQGKVIFTLCANDLLGANLQGADLRHADLNSADMRYADLSGANMRYADLSGANLRGASLIGTNLSGTNLSGADLGCADLSGANMRSANIIGADLSGANVLNINSSDATNDYDIFATSTHMKIGCQFHKWGDWMGFDDEAIIKMDGDAALKFWRVWKPILRAIAKDRGWM
jgi:uncharacterized protein YjbI with pentapeptide repeats